MLKYGEVLKMTYSEIMIELASTDVQKASDIATMLNLGGMYIEDYSDLMENEIVKQVGIVDEELLQKDKTQAIMHVYIDENTSIEDCIAFIEERFSSENIKYLISRNKINEEDYSTSWKKYYKPIKIDDIVVVPEWEKYEPKTDEKILVIDPGMAFGTGTHETTSMCIEAIQQYVKNDDEIFDVGTGSGILSITALLCGAKSVTAVDIDQNAIKVAYENAELNNVENKLDAYPLDILTQQAPDKIFNVITANIVADVIIAILPKIKPLLNGFFIASGIITERAEDVKKALSENGLEIVEIKEKKGWNCIISK
ncbi:MAG: 50S ribosomal protein L11 methyltransferase [Clostridiales bacterium]|nr:MAG: 50S ribosomal protein L11 methyltransferase [Clostridiales bacterium]